MKKQLIILALILSCIQCNAQTNIEEKSINSEFGAFNIFDNHSASITLSIESAINTALDNNIALEIKRFEPAISATAIDAEKAKFDTTVSATISADENRGKSFNNIGNMNDVASNKSNAAVSLTRKSTDGTITTFELDLSRSRGNSPKSLFSSGFSATVQHPLRRGAGLAINRISLRKAELDLDWSEYELKGYIIDVVASVKKSYWQYYLSLRELEIVKKSLDIAKQQREETIQRINAGRVAESETAAAEAEVAMRYEDLINAESQSVTSAVTLLRIINNDTEDFWRLRPELSDKLEIDHLKNKNLDYYIENAIKLRPEIAQAELLLEKNELNVIQSRNGMLPKLDFFITLGKTGYSSSWDNSAPSLNDKDDYGVTTGIVYELSRGRREAKTLLTKAKLNKAVQIESIKNLKQLIKQDVINAYIEVKRTLQQITATIATSEKQLEKLRVEMVKFDVGRTTSFQVAQAQRDLTAAVIAEAKASVDYTNAIIELYRSDGSLLERNNIILR